jgi:ribose transport system permease protein
MTSMTSTPSHDQQVDDRALSAPPLWRRVLGANGMWVLGLDLMLILFFTLKSPGHVFWSTRNAQNELLNGTEGLILGLAMTSLLAAGLIDLSVGQNLVLASVVGAHVMSAVSGGTTQGLGAVGGATSVHNAPLAIALGALACLASGALFGAVNGVIIAYLRVNSLIATLGTLSVGMGLVLIITSGSDIGGLPPQIQTDFGLASMFGKIPYPTVVGVVVAVGIWALFKYTRFGMHTLAIGSERISAERGGIQVRPHVVKLTMLAGILAGVAAFIDLSHFGSTAINGHTNDPLAAITAAVIGGTALVGGRISVIGTIWGAALAVILLGGLVVIGVSSFYQLVAIGTVLIAAVAIDQYRNRRRERH